MPESTPPETGGDQALSLEAIYYPAPIPSGPVVLSVLGVVFDKVHFPHVMIPTSGFDQTDLDKEIERIAGLSNLQPDDHMLLAILRFVEHAKTLEGFCSFDPPGDLFEGRDVPADVLLDLYSSVNPPRPGRIPIFNTGHAKGLPNSDETIGYPGTYHYFALAHRRAIAMGLPLVNDVSGVPFIGEDEPVPHNDARHLSAAIAIEATKLVLPTLPILRPIELMEFRAENVAALRQFRRALLGYAKDLNPKIKGMKVAELEELTNFFVRTEIAPVLDELKQSLTTPARPWYRRIAEGAGVVTTLGAGLLTTTPTIALGAALAAFVAQMSAEVIAHGEQRDKIQRSNLYYLLQLKRLRTNK